MFAATEATRINAIRDKLREKADMGMLGVVAAQARVSEGTLYDWLCDPAKVPSRAEMMDIQAALSEKVDLSGEDNAEPDCDWDD